MSCDFAVWAPNPKLDDESAQRLYEALCEGDDAGVEPSPAVDAFHAELTKKHPEIDDVAEDQLDDLDLCPWSIAMDRSPGHLIMCCVWSRAAYVEGLIKDLARKHGLTVYDPQTGTMTSPAN